LGCERCYQHGIHVSLNAGFNQDIGGWNVSGVTNMNGMFWNSRAFNQDIGGWDVSSVTTMSQMFENAADFNYALCWNVTSVLADQVRTSRTPEILIEILGEDCSAAASPSCSPSTSPSSSPSTSPSMDILNFCDCDDECCAIEKVDFMESREFVVDPVNSQTVRQVEYNSIAAMKIPANIALHITR